MVELTPLSSLILPLCLVGVEGATAVFEAVDPVGDGGTFPSELALATGKRVLGAEE
jgi:hypothetical protein